MSDEPDLDDSELIEMGKRRITRTREAPHPFALPRDANASGRATRAAVYVDDMHERATDVDVPISGHHFDPTRVVTSGSPPIPTTTEWVAKAPTIDLHPGQNLPPRLTAQEAVDDISNLYTAFVDAVRRCTQHIPDIDEETFSRHVTKQRELVMTRHDTPHLDMHVEVVGDRPLVVILPRAKT